MTDYKKSYQLPQRRKKKRAQDKEYFMENHDYELIYPGLFEYQIIDFHYKNDLFEIEETYIDLTFARDNKVIILRFFNPVDIRLSGAFNPQQGGGFQILDIKNRQLENIGIQVSNFEPMEGNFEFYARNVEKLFEGRVQDILMQD